MSLEQRLPTAYSHLVEVREIVERHFQDVCDLEFTIQDRQLFINEVSRAKRTPIANLRFALQFLDEGKITPHEFLRRVTINDVAIRLLPVIRNKDTLCLLGRGIPGYSGVATGKIAFRVSEVLDLLAKRIPVILAKIEVSPEDIKAIAVSQGVLATRGGVSSHAALTCRKLCKPCVVAFSPTCAKFDDVRSLFQEGSWITIDGTSGEVFEGQAKCEVMDWREEPELVAVSVIVGWAIATGNVPCSATGQVWRISDFFLHSTPLARGLSAKRPVTRSSFTSFTHPSRDTLARVQRSLTPLALGERDNCGEVLLSLMDVLFRLLSSALGVGNHPRYFRPLWDPKQCVERTTENEINQLVGMEFFGINQHVSHLLDVATITLFLELSVTAESSEWFLDFTNPLGESLIAGSESVLAYRLLINDAEVQHGDLPALYNSLRRREYRWQFYEMNLTSHAEIIDCLVAWASKKSTCSPLLLCCVELGLILNHKLTMAGESLVGRLHRNKKYEFSRANVAS